MGYSPWDRKDSDMTEQLTHTHTHIHTSHFVYLSMDTGCFHILAIVSDAVMNVGVYVSFELGCMYLFVFS